MRTALVMVALGLVAAQGSAQQAQAARSERVIAIRAGRLLDVSAGSVVENATIVVRGDRIEAVGRDVRVPAGAQVIDLSDQTVMPGFIDMHTHSDLSLLVCPGGDSKIHQGVTTEVVGNCGFSPAPLTVEHAATVRSPRSMKMRTIASATLVESAGLTTMSAYFAKSLCPVMPPSPRRNQTPGSAPKPPFTSTAVKAMSLVSSSAAILPAPSKATLNLRGRP